MKRIYLLTAGFPYADGEQFIETEILYLSKYAEEVIIIPLTISGKKRNVPDNVYTFNVLANEVANTPTVVKMAIALLNIIKNPKEIKLHGPYLKTLVIWAYYRRLMEKHITKLFSESDNTSGKILVYSYWLSPSAVASLSIKAYNSDVKIVARAHGSDLYEQATNLPAFPFRENTIHEIDKIFCISRNGKSHLEKKFNSKNVIVSRLGVTSDSKNNLLNKDLGRVVLVSCSNIIDLKRVSKILETVYRFSQRNKDMQVRWVHLSTGPLLNNLEREVEVIQKKTHNLSCELLGQITNRDVIKFYDNNYIDCFINLSTSEGIPVSIMEAFSFGIPVVATDVGGVSEIVGPSSGFLLDVECTQEQVVSALEHVTSPENFKNYRHGAKEVWSKKYNADNNYHIFCKELEKLFTKPDIKKNSRG